MQLADDRKNRQKKIEQEAKNDSQDKQEVERRRKLLLLMLYNQYLKKRMESQLNKYEELEYIFQQIRDIVGTQDLGLIINFVMQRSKRYNYNLQIVDEKQKKIDRLQKDIKQMKSILTKLKNEVVVKDKEKAEENALDNNGLNKKEINMIKIENEKNQQLNIKAMEEYDMNNPLELGEDEKEEKEEIKKEENNKIKLTKEEEDIVEGYDNLLNKILKAFNILYLCKSKTEFINLMREKGISQQNQQNSEENKISVVTTKRTKKKKKSKRSSVKSPYKRTFEESEIKKTVEEDEEDDTSNNDQDKNTSTSGNWISRRQAGARCSNRCPSLRDRKLCLNYNNLITNNL